MKTIGPQNIPKIDLVITSLIWWKKEQKNGLNSSMQNSTVGSGQQYFVSGFTEELAFIFQILVRFGSVRRKN